jgi:RNA polymerase sigma-70 factor (ECF subfamily)
MQLKEVAVQNNKSSVEENDKLLKRALAGDQEAFAQIFERNRKRLQQTIALRMDSRLNSRVDSSDVLQETYLEAARKFKDYSKERTMPLLVWLRWIAREKIISAYRRHIAAGRRSIVREVPMLPVDSSVKLVINLVSDATSPSRKVARTEIAALLRRGLERLEPDDRELILMHHFEGLTTRDAARCLRMGEAAAAKRYERARARLRRFLMQKGVSGTS